MTTNRTQDDAAPEETSLALEANDGETGPEGAGTLVEMVLAELAPSLPPARIDGVVIGVVTGLGPSGEPMVDYPGNELGGLPSLTTAEVDESAIGREAALMFERGDPARPLLLGLLRRPQPASAPAPSPEASVEVLRDGERLVLSADKEIVLQCGKASITLTAAGKVLIRGAYVLARSSGLHQIQGGSVQIN